MGRSATSGHETALRGCCSFRGDRAFGFDERLALSLFAPRPELGCRRRLLCVEGYDPVFGARPLKRVIQSALQNQLAEMLLAGEIDEGDTLPISAGTEGLIVGVHKFLHKVPRKIMRNGRTGAIGT